VPTSLARELAQHHDGAPVYARHHVRQRDCHPEQLRHSRYPIPDLLERVIDDLLGFSLWREWRNSRANLRCRLLAAGCGLRCWLWSQFDLDHVVRSCTCLNPAQKLLSAPLELEHIPAFTSGIYHVQRCVALPVPTSCPSSDAAARLNNFGTFFQNHLLRGRIIQWATGVWAGKLDRTCF